MTKTPIDKNKYSENRLKKEELLEYLSDWYEYSQIEKALNVIYKTDEQAYQQIKEMIQASTNLRNKSLGKLAQDLGVSFSAVKIIHDHAQPTITEKDIEGWADEARERVCNDHDWWPLEAAMKEMLTELGVSITVDRGNKQTIVASKYNDRKV